MKQRLHNAVHSRSAKLKRLAFALVGTGVSLLPMSANAQTTGGGGGQTYTLGTYGPAPADFVAAAQGFATNIGGILTAVLGIMMLLMAVWKGPALYQKIINKSAKV